MRRKAEARGKRGSWFAEVDGETLPCVHKHWLQGRQYHDPQAAPGQPPWDDFIAAIKSGRKVVLTRDTYLGGIRFERTGYVAVFTVDDVAASDGALTFKLTDRVVDLA